MKLSAEHLEVRTREFSPTFDELYGLVEKARRMHYGHSTQIEVIYEVDSFTATLVVAKGERQVSKITITPKAQ